MFTTISTTPNGDTVEPPLRVVGGFNDEYWKLKRQATQKAEEAAAAAWNQRSAWQPLPSPPPITPSAPHAFTEGQSITVDGIRGPGAHWNGTYVVDSVNPGTITP